MDANTTSRRRFLGTAAGATGVALGAAVWGAGQAAAAAIPGEATQKAMANVKRSVVSGKFALEIGTIKCGFLQDADGGQAFSDVVVEKLGADHVQHKHLAGVKYEDITLSAGLGMEKTFYDWLAASWQFNNANSRKNGAVVFTDFNYAVRQTRQFYNALISETTIPACDASSKDAARLTITIAPDHTSTTTKGSGNKYPSLSASAQKTWLPANFKLQIDGLDCSKVAKIDSFTVKQSIIENAVGDDRIGSREPGAIEYPNLAITFLASSAASWQQWFDDFVVKGNNGDANEKNGTLTFLSNNLQAELGTVKFFNMGIFKLDDDAAEDSGGNVVQRFRAELYVERMEISIVGSGPPAPTPAP